MVSWTGCLDNSDRAKLTCAAGSGLTKRDFIVSILGGHSRRPSRDAPTKGIRDSMIRDCGLWLMAVTQRGRQTEDGLT